MLSRKHQQVVIALIGILILTGLLHLGTFCGLDTDFQAYSLYSTLIYNGHTPYVDFFTHKPPLYFYLLLPGNLLGGRLISFFWVHLAYVSLLNCLLFYYATTLTEKFSLFRGFCAWLLFNMITVARFFAYGNLNGSIVYVSLGFSLLAFFLLLKVRKCEERYHCFLRSAFLAGIFSSLSFLTRFGLAPNFVLLAVLCHLVFAQRVSWKGVVSLIISYGTGRIIPIVIMLAVLGFPIKESYEQLIEFNFLYSGLSNSNILLSLLGRTKKKGIKLIEHAEKKIKN